MSNIHKHTRSPLLSTLRKAFFLSKESSRLGVPPDELLAQSSVADLHRRRFIGDVFKTGVALSAAGLLNGCRKAADFFPAENLPPSTARIDAKKSQPSIVVLGAGMAGLNCSYHLKKAGYLATIYEGATRTGGRIFSQKNVISPALTTELGGEFIDSEHTDMLKLCAEFGLPLIDTLTPQEAALARDSFFIDGRFYSEAEVIAAFAPYQQRIAADIDSLPDEITFLQYDQTTAFFDRMNLKAYLDSVGMTGFLRKGIEVAYLTEYGLETEEQSSINFLYLFSPDTSEGFEIFGSSDERFKVLGGNQQVTNALYNEVKEQVKLQHQLVRIKETAQGYSLAFSTGGSTVSVNADLVVCTLPFSILRNIDLQVSLPQWKRNAIDNLGYGTNSKLFLGFNRRVWRSYGYTGYMFSDADIQTGWDNSQLQGGTAGGFTVYGGGKKGLQLGSGTPQSQAPKFVSQLEKMWPGCAGAYTGVAQRMHWPEYPFTKGSYACYKVGQYTAIRGAEALPVGNLFFAGEHCSLSFQGFMNGAAETGREAAKAVTKALKGKTDLVLN